MYAVPHHGQVQLAQHAYTELAPRPADPGSGGVSTTQGAGALRKLQDAKPFALAALTGEVIILARYNVVSNTVIICCWVVPLGKAGTAAHGVMLVI